MHENHYLEKTIAIVWNEIKCNAQFEMKQMYNWWVSEFIKIWA